MDKKDTHKYDKDGNKLVWSDEFNTLRHIRLFKVDLFILMDISYF